MESSLEVIKHISLLLEAASSNQPIAVQCLSFGGYIYVVQLADVEGNFRKLQGQWSWLEPWKQCWSSALLWQINPS